MWSRIITATIIAVIVGGIGWALWPRPVAVDTAQVQRRDLEVAIEADGTSRIREVFRLSAPMAGRMTRVEIHVGDPVAEGQPVATIEPMGPGLLDERSLRVAQASVEAAEAGVAMAEAALSQAETQSRFAEGEFERTIRLADRGLVSTQARERAELEAQNAQRSVEVARATLEMRRRELESARAALIQGQGSVSADSCCADVVAPVSGRVLAVATESEQIVASGTPIMDIGDPRDLQIAVEVVSSDAVRIPDGADATIVGWGGPPLAAVVARVDPVAQTRVSALGIEEQRTRVVLELDDDPERYARLGHGFRVTARIVLWRGEQVVTVPIGALFRRGADWAAYAVEDGRVRLRVLTIGQRSQDHAEVLSGLQEGDVVVVHPGDTLSDGAAVAPREAATTR